MNVAPSAAEKTEGVLEAATLGLLIARRNFTSAALLTWVRAVGELVVARSIVRARASLSDVVGVPGRAVTRRTDDRRESIDVGALHAGDVVVVATSERIPVDGTIVRGEAMVNQQSMTGEALPVEQFGSAIRTGFLHAWNNPQLQAITS